MSNVASQVQEAPSAEITVLADVTRQFREDAGPDPLPAEQDFMLKQKYGLVSPQLTLSELNLIRREERSNGRR